jgi:hypothetical protein
MNIKTNINDKHILKHKSDIEDTRKTCIVKNCVLNVKFVMHFNHTLNISLI